MRKDKIKILLVPIVLITLFILMIYYSYMSDNELYKRNEYTPYEQRTEGAGLLFPDLERKKEEISIITKHDNIARKDSLDFKEWYFSFISKKSPGFFPHITAIISIIFIVIYSLIKLLNINKKIQRI